MYLRSFRGCLFPGLILLLGAAGNKAGAADPQALQMQGRAIVETFASRLQSELQAAMNAGGPVNAIDVCKARAPAIAAELSEDGWQVGRTSLRVRNPANAPDAFERRILQDFETRKNAGWAVEKLEFYQSRQQVSAEMDEAVNEFRYMKAIPTRPVCLTCHGNKLPEDVRRKIDTAYPGDEARGYRTGDIRGAFSLRKRLQARTVEPAAATVGSRPD